MKYSDDGKWKGFLPGHSTIVQPNFTIEFDPELGLERVNLKQNRNPSNCKYKVIRQTK
jgi:hypothetical protein